MPPTTKTRKPPPVPSDDNLPGEDELPDMEKRSRTPKLQKLESAVAGLYIMGGGALSTLPDQVGGARLKYVGLNIARSSDEIAEAWLDLAEDDKRVLKALESLTSFSGWGKVIGVHLMAVGAAVPGIAAAMPQQQPQQQQQTQPGNGATDVQTAMVLAEMFRQAQSQERQERPDNVPPPVQQQRVQQPHRAGEAVRRQAGPVSTRPGRNAGIPSAADLGVSIADAPADFPTAGPENIRG